MAGKRGGAAAGMSWVELGFNLKLRKKEEVGAKAVEGELAVIREDSARKANNDCATPIDPGRSIRACSVFSRGGCAGGRGLSQKLTNTYDLAFGNCVIKETGPR